MSNNIRIRTTPNGPDKYLKVNLEQDFDFLEILSLKISQEDVYRKFSSDYGVIVGRVIINSGFGVPNAKVSVFIPLDEADKNDTLISGLYPYEIVTDKDSDGIRYNLLPKESETNNSCYTPVGTFPTKREVLDNETILGVYCKYYKYTTTTNYAGDFMIFGVPVGTYTVHVDADISDIGIASQRPYDLIRQGTPVKFFDSSTKFKGGTNLDKLVQVKTANVGVNVQPFWGDTENYEIGITRLDIDFNYNIVPSAIFLGSIYGDQGKDSINKVCRPRKALGEMCSQVTGPGSIEMIRHTIDGQIEEFDVDGGRVIDEDGTWAYQIPMNLDYMVTGEDGTLIPSQDINIGLPTRAKVRFRIGMDETGGEGRLRTRAKYLVPNNPQTTNEIDYIFGKNTKETSFKELYWNKIYTVSNFITRYQKNVNPATPAKTRNITGMKNVDACAGDKTPFPYNRVNTQVNPIFFMICLIIKIMAFLIYVMNAIIIPIINGIVTIIRGIVSFINGLGAHANKPDYVSCLTVECDSGDGEGSVFAPGCKKDSKGYEAAAPPPNYCCGDEAGHSCEFGNAVGLDDCISFQMAKSLNLFQFDFYNDWVNGTLFGFLLKYKKRRRGREKFCEYDCADYSGDQNYSGVDGNGNGIADNNCYNHILLDSCIKCGDTDENCQNKSNDSGTIREGLIKKYEDELYYASTTHNLNYKLFATDIICLGSVFECDWQGIPKLQPYLVPTTYKLPPDIQEIEYDENGDAFVMETGMVDIGGNTMGDFFSINCLGLHVNARQCLNLRHICELSVDIDQYVEDIVTGSVISEADGTIGSWDIDNDLGKQIRDSFIYLNRNAISVTSFNIGAGLSSDFNTQNTLNYYNFASSTSDNGEDYINFRGYPAGGDDFYSQPDHSLFMYFGIIPGKTALDKMNQRYFTNCRQKLRHDMIIESTVTPDLLGINTGSVIFKFIGGTGPYTCTVNGPNSYYFSGSVLTSPTIVNESISVQLTGLGQGVYTIYGTDALGYPVTQTISVGGPTPLYCSVFVSQNVTLAGVNNGQIKINAIGGGIPPYSYILKDGNGSIINSSSISVNPPIPLNGLGIDDVGYTVIVNDSSTGACITTGLTISGPSVISLSSTTTPVSCYNGLNGTITITVGGAAVPYLVTTIGPNGFTSNSLNLSGLDAGTYETTIIDGLNNTTSSPLFSVVGTSQPAVQLSGTVTTVQVGSNYTHTIAASGGIGPYVASPIAIGTVTNTSATISTTITDSVGCTRVISG